MERSLTYRAPEEVQKRISSRNNPELWRSPSFCHPQFVMQYRVDVVSLTQDPVHRRCVE